MQFDGEKVRYSASDLAQFLDGDYSTWMDRWHLRQRQTHSSGAKQKPARGSSLSAILEGCSPDGEDAELQMLRDRGFAHEAKHLKRFHDAGRQVVEIPADQPNAGELTLKAMQEGAEIIYQARLDLEPFVGYADFLIRRDGRSKFGDYHYEPWDTKLAKSPKPHYLVQLCTYVDMLEALQGVVPDRVVILLGNDEQHPFMVDKYLYYFRELKRQFLEFHERFDPDNCPHPGLSPGHGRWAAAAQEIIEKTDHLSLVAGMRRRWIKELEQAGVLTVAELVAMSPAKGKRLLPTTFERLQAQATLQVASRTKPRPEYQVLPQVKDDPCRGLAVLPPASKLDVFFDLEGFPLIEGGLEYLFGAAYLEKGKFQFVDWWAHDALQEKNAFEGFIDWAYARWRKDPSMHIYHYAGYELTAVRRLMGKYATREKEVDDLLRSGVLVDLYTVVRQGLIVGTPSYSLKDIEKLFANSRDGGVKTAAGSMVAYESWLTEQDGPTWQESKILEEIRDYNRVDCESTGQLAEWLRDQQKNHGIKYLAGEASQPMPEQTESDKPPPQSQVLANRLLAELIDNPSGDAEYRRTKELLAWLLEFHRREAKPIWWRMFDRHEASEEELIDDLDCLGGLERTSKPSEPIKLSKLYEYRFDPNQDTKLHPESVCFFAHDLAVQTTILSLDLDRGLVEIKLGPKRDKPPSRLSLIPDEYVSAELIANAVYRYVEAWIAGKSLSSAVDDLLHRRKPRISGHAGGSLISIGSDFLVAVTDVVKRMDNTVLCIQGPPGTGKTYTAATAIVELLRQGKRVGVTANSHKAIINVLAAVCERAAATGFQPCVIKVGGDEDDLSGIEGITYVEKSATAEELLDGTPLAMGGTAWLFSRPGLEQKFDYLFVDEAGQFSLANTIGVALSAMNLVLIGDQMQLAQPTLGSHPGDSGRSALDYLLDGVATIQPDLGIFLGTTWRMHPGVCDFISAAIYERRLLPHPDTAKQQIVRNGSATSRLSKNAGVLFVVVPHVGNSQCSDEEVDAIAELAGDLLGHAVLDRGSSTPRPLAWDDILFVSPFNMQVRRLQQRLGPQARVGSVDKFQGQEAHVVLVSMCSSSLEDSPRGADFLLNPNRLNVAISRAKTLAVVVGCRDIMSARCRSIPDMELVNLYCWLGTYADVERQSDPIG